MLSRPQKILLLVIILAGFIFIFFFKNLEEPKDIERKEIMKNQPPAVSEVAIQDPEIDDEGYLWVDRTTEQYIVTLGAAHGVVPGSKLLVFHGDRYIGEVEVDITFESISYVAPDMGKEMFETGDYYKVVANK